MSPAMYLVIAVFVGVICLLGGGAVALREADTTGDLALLSAVVLLGALCGGVMWPLALAGGVFWGGLLLCRSQIQKREVAVFYPAAVESDADKYRRMACEERSLARLHQGTPELAKMHEQLAAQYDGMADIYMR